MPSLARCGCMQGVAGEPRMGSGRRNTSQVRPVILGFREGRAGLGGAREGWFLSGRGLSPRRGSQILISSDWKSHLSHKCRETSSHHLWGRVLYLVLSSIVLVPKTTGDNYRQLLSSNPTSALMTCVTVGSFLKLSVPVFFYLKKKGGGGSCLL